MPFKKGDPNINRKGRPKDGQSWAAVLSKLCDEKVTSSGTEITKKEAICRKLLKLAFEGEKWAIEALMDRIDGKPKQITESDITTNGKDITAIERRIVDPANPNT